MITINIDPLDAFYLTMAIVALGFAIMVAFGRTEEKRGSRNSRTTTTS